MAPDLSSDDDDGFLHEVLAEGQLVVILVERAVGNLAAQDLETNYEKFHGECPSVRIKREKYTDTVQILSLLKVPKINDGAGETPLGILGPRSSEDKFSLNQYMLETTEAQANVMREIAKAATRQVEIKIGAHMPICQYHRKTGRIRTPREHSDSESSSSGDDTGSNAETDGDKSIMTSEARYSPSSSGYRQHCEAKVTSSSSFTLSAGSNGRWIRTSTGKYSINPVKCPPCARRKKGTKCRGGPPCRECWSKGRRSAVLCQEWSEDCDIEMEQEIRDGENETPRL
ncbi:hypothetical protein M430DRAFT_277687 [Amorphotheca resinae ATCC 22711]|uniref:Uncharacterized protein n=1 Tax=Amorphotheca resinae ATCC 22711 TaxID=857342 RepID=A0A2T3AZ69_AMORE|nr:hypothetical protein M430DRAFT_277687 [Amorphotheca resinae ATCC 22711]PSS15376.1 hypothetical protein M430DRAFT_277687 [Amorphotheca resinae ATCC 22711]